MNKSRKKRSPAPMTDSGGIKDFLDMIAPSVIDFKVDHFLCGNTYRCVWALREYPTSTDEQAILRHLGEMDGVTIRIYTRQVTASEEKRIIHNAANRNRMSRSSTEDLQQTVTAEANLQDVVTLVSTMHRNREPLLHCAVFLELTASSYDALKLLQTDVLTELVRSKLNVDRLLLRQREGFVSVMPPGWNHFGEQFERVLPASSVANLYPFNYSGKTDPHGFYIGKDKYGANILVDFDKRDDDKTSASILILGNSGQGKSYLLKLLLLNFLEAGKSVISLDVEHEQQDMCERVGGCFMDLMGGVYRINPLEPKCWDEGGDPEDTDAPEAFRKSTRLSQHISFLKDFFRAYKDFSDRHIDAIEIMVSRLYEKWGISDTTDFGRLKPEDYPILSDLYDLIEEEYQGYDADAHQLYTAELLQEILLGLHSMCKGAEAKFFNGHTNVTSSRFIVFGVKGLLQANRSVRGAMLFNILSFMSDRLLTIGNTKKNYGAEGAEVIVDNCQVNLYGGFAPASQTAVELSKALGSRTVMSGSISRGKNDPSQSLQMIERPLMTPDELKSMPKGSFIVAKTGVHPMKVKLRLFLDWGIRFGEPYEVPEKAQRAVAYADKQELEESIIRRHYGTVAEEEPPQDVPAAVGGMNHGMQAEKNSRKTILRP